MFRRGPIGIAHAKVDNVLARAASLHLHLPRNVEYIRREPLNPTELFHNDSIINRALAVNREQASGTHCQWT
jgi:hypothetical protein